MPIKLPSFRARRDVYPADLWTKCPTCEDDAVQQAARQGHAGLPDLRPPFPAVGRDATRASSSIPAPGPSAMRVSSRSTAGVRRPEAVPRPARRGAGGDRDARRGGLGDGSDRRDPVAICVMDFGFMGGSMGAVVGEKVARAAEHALEARMPLVVVSASGGARMQEGTLALMQLAKTIAALERLRDGRRPVPVTSCPTRPPAACSPRSPRSATSTSRSPTRSSGSPGRGSRPGRSRRSCRPVSSARNSCSSTGSSTGSSAGPTCARAGRAPAPAPGPGRRGPRASGRPRYRDAGLPAVLVPVLAGRTRRGPHQRRTPPRHRPNWRPMATRGTTSGRGSSSPATCAAADSRVRRGA